MIIRNKDPGRPLRGQFSGMEEGGGFRLPLPCASALAVDCFPCLPSLKYRRAVSAEFNSVIAVVEDADKHILDATTHAIHRNMRSEIWNLHGYPFLVGDLLTF
jgi:hypothetical protein